MADKRRGDAAGHEGRPPDTVEATSEFLMDGITTDPVLQEELDTLESMLRTPPAEEGAQYLEESGCQRFVELVAAIGRDPSSATRDGVQVRDAGPNAPDSADAGGAVRETPTLKRLGQYELLAKLGQGGMGAVYKALHTRLQKVVALKVLPEDKLKDEDAVARFDREMRAVGRLNHPNIIAAHDAGEIDGHHYLVMELVDGIDVSTLVKRFQDAVKPADNQTVGLPIPEACDIIRQAADGLQHAHEHSMVHRDVKPSNLMVALGGQRSAGSRDAPARRDQQRAADSRSLTVSVKLLDLGLALFDDRHQQDAENLTGTGQVMGTIDYMAPEQGGDSHEVDIRADVYALGATLYKLLAGRAPFADERYDSVINKLMALATETPTALHEIRGDVPQELSDFVARLLAKSRDERPATPREVADTLAPYAAGARLPELLQFVEQALDAATDRKSDTFAYLSSSFTETHRPATPAIPPRTAAPRVVPPPAAPKAVPPPAAPRVIQPEAGPRITPRRAPRPKPNARRWLPIVAGLAIFLVLAAVSVLWLSGLLVTVETPRGTVRIEVPQGEEENIAIAVLDDARRIRIVDATDDWTVELEDGQYRLDVHKGGDRFQLDPNELTISSNDRLRVKVTFKPAQVARSDRDDRVQPPSTDSAPSEAATVEEVEPHPGQPTPGPAVPTDAYGALSRPAEFDFANTPLDQVARFLEKKHGIPFWIERWALAKVGLDVQAPVTAKSRGGTLAENLSAALKPLDLMWTIEGNLVVITTADEAKQRVHTCVYKPVRPVDLNNLIDEIRTNIPPEAWDSVGGRGSIKPMSVGALVVTQRPDVHQQIRQHYSDLLESIRPPSPARPTRADDHASLDEVLDQSSTCDFAGTSLANALKQLGDRHGIHLGIDERSFQGVGIAPDTPITCKLSGAPLRTLLTLMLREVGLTWTVTPTGIIVTTPREARKTLELIAYDAADLANDGDYTELIDVIKSTIAPDAWTDTGGPGSVRGSVRGTLDVRQNYHVHRQIEDLLAALQQVKSAN
jgi:serine/threonine protein kinase